MMSEPHIPVVRLGKPYQSMDRAEIRSHRGGVPLATIGQANAGLIRRDMKRLKDVRAALNEHSCETTIAICRKAADIFMHERLPVGVDGETHDPREYVETLSATSGLPHRLCRNNMEKIRYVLAEMGTILAGLTRGLDLKVIDEGLGRQGGSTVSYYAATDALGVILPSNSPGVNSIWMPAVALKIPVLLKPGREEPWTPYRIMQALIQAGCPAEAFSFYPTDHEGSGAILKSCGRAILFGDENTVAQYADNPAVNVHGPGWSKVLLGDDGAKSWSRYLDVLVRSICDNGGRSCINASAILTPAHAEEIADALARRMAAIEPRSADDEAAALSAFANPKFAEAIDAAIEDGLKTSGAEDMTARYRQGGRLVEFEGSVYLRPTLIACDSFAHPLANREFLFPFASIVTMPQSEMVDRIGPSLVVTAVTHDPAMKQALMRSPHIDRLNLGPIPTSQVTWDQPHEGNLFEFLYKRRAIQCMEE